MPIVMCPSCGRFNKSPTPRPRGLHCEMCGAALDPGGTEPEATLSTASVTSEPAAIEIDPVSATSEAELTGRQTVGRLIAMSGVSLMFLGGLVVLGGVREPKFGCWGVVAGTVMGALGGALWNLGQRMSAKSVAQAETDDPRKAVLLLRRFSDDNRNFGVRDPVSPFVPYSSMEQQTFEQVVAERFAVTGPVIAIGKPGEFLPSLGAARTYVGDDEWQAQIEEYLKRARRVVMILGRIEGEGGLAWELRKIWETVPPERVVFVVPPVDEEEARARWTALVDRSDGRVPSYEGGELVASFGPDGACQVVRAKPGDRLNQSQEYADALAAIARTGPDAALACDVELVEPFRIPAAPPRKRLWPYPFASWQTSLACFVGMQASFGMCMGFGGTQGGIPRSAAPHSSADYAIGITVVPGLVFLGGFFASILAIYDRKVRGIRPTDAAAGVLATGMVVSWLAALAFTGFLVVGAFKSFVLGIPPTPHSERIPPRIEPGIEPFRIE